MNCYTRQVEFEKENGKKIKLTGESRKILVKNISTLMAIKYLRKGYEEYLASVMEERKKGATLKELSVTTRTSRSMTGTREWKYIKYPKPIVSLGNFFAN